MRLFIGFPLPNEVKNELEILDKTLRLRGIFGNENISWSNPETRHITLEFLGEIGDMSLSQIVSTIHQTALICPLINLSLSSLTCFPNCFKPSVLVQEVVSDKNGFLLQKKLRKILREKNLSTDEKEWRPHITIGRFRKKISLKRDGLKVDVSKISWVTSEIYLYESILEKNGSRYVVVEKFKLGK